VSAIYTTTDGGSGMQDLYDLVALLGEHVELVDHEALADFALRHHRTVGRRGY
jgi:predicted RNA-binding protein associated with RNAse of E/G family